MSQFNFDSCAFDYTKSDDDWVKLTLPLGVKLNLDDFQPLAAMLFYQLTSFYYLWTVLTLVTGHAHLDATH